MVSEKTGKTLTMCQEHQREYWKSHKTTEKPSYKAARAGAGVTPKPKGKRQPKPTPAPSLPPISEPRALADMLLNAEEGQFVLIDQERAEIWRVTAVREHLAVDAGKLNLHTLPILRRAGYRIVSIKER
jgi:hypothetical protein